MILLYCLFVTFIHGKGELKTFMKKLSNLSSLHMNKSERFTYESYKENLALLDSKVNLSENELTIDLYLKRLHILKTLKGH